jgi:hypothetical protein
LRKKPSLNAREKRGLKFQKQGISLFKTGRPLMEQFASGAGPTMNVSERKKVEPEQLARRIRKLAIDSHNAVKNPFVTAAKLDELYREIHELRRVARAGYMSEIECWLQNVQRQVENRCPAVRLTSRV